MRCNACPRRCNVDRAEKAGFCGAPEGLRVARAALHEWEEPCISGKNGSGTVFFSGCNLGCIFCQNAEISHGRFGKDITDLQLMRIFDDLIERGAENLNLVTPTPFAERLSRVLREYRSPVPVVYNCSGYELPETLRLLEGLVDVYLPDLKYSRAQKAERYAQTADYYPAACAAIAEMKRQRPRDVFENGMLKEGVLIRHLILPGNTNSTIEILEYLKETYGDETLVSLMAQYTPCGETPDCPELQRRITEREYQKALDALLSFGFKNAYVQELSSADAAFIPPFDLTGIPKEDAT